MVPSAKGLAALLLLVSEVVGVDHAKFRTCQQTGFCRRHRVEEKPRPYVVAPGSLAVDAGSGEVKGTLHGGPFGVALSLRLLAYSCGVARLRITEANPLHGPRWEPDDILEAGLEQVPVRAMDAAALGASHPLHAPVAAGEAVAYGFGSEGAIVAITYHPFKAQVYLGESNVITLNPTGRVRAPRWLPSPRARLASRARALRHARGAPAQFYFEHHRKRDDTAKPLAAPDADVHAGKTIVDYGEDGLAVYSDGTKQQRAEDAEARAGRAS